MAKASTKNEMYDAFAASCKKSIAIYVVGGVFANYLLFGLTRNPALFAITTFFTGIIVLSAIIDKIFENIDELINERITQLEEQRQHE
jgi:hypothetical protein